jgi:isochorismate hydrolase
MTRQERGLLADFWGPGMTADESDRDFVPALAPHPEDRLLVKWRYSAFHATSLLDDLRARGRDQLIVVGVYAHVGILATAIEAMSHGIQPFVPVDAVADFSAEEHEMAAGYIARRCGQVLSTERILDHLTAPAGVLDRTVASGTPDLEMMA